MENYKKELSTPALLLNGIRLLYIYILFFIFKSTTEPSQKIAGYQIGRWNTSERGKDMRGILEKVAARISLDPLLPETWYAITRRDVEAVPVILFTSPPTPLSYRIFSCPLHFSLLSSPCLTK